MRNNLNLLPDNIKEILVNQGIKELTPPQEKSILLGLLDGKNLVVSSPTASGKTLIAEIAIINNYFKTKKKAIYLCPMKSLANEKYESFTKKYSFLKTALSIGDFDKVDAYLQDYDVIITSNEKMDSLLRHGIRWIRNTSTIIVDEVHLINDLSRGPTLEVLITRLRKILPNAQFIYLSATIKNDVELSKWLDARLVKSNFRPISLIHGNLLFNKIIYEDGTEKILNFGVSDEESLLKDTIIEGKQIIFFLTSRRNTESLAKRLARSTENMLSEEVKKELNKVSEKLKNVLETPTTQCMLLSEVVKKGVAFHHAGLLMEQRNIIEVAFKNNLIKCICATPTLAVGVNLPAYRVVVRDLKRYDGYGSNWIPVLEYSQQAGRAGRPDYDKKGEALTISRSEEEQKIIIERYINGENEEIYSKLSAEPILRTHVLSLITDLFARHKKSLLDFFKSTFWAYQFKGDFELESKVLNVINELAEWGFIKIEKDNYLCTPIGKRISELYLDPLSAHKILVAFNNIKNVELNEISLLQLITNCVEMHNLLKVSSKDHPLIIKLLNDWEKNFLIKEPSPFDYYYEQYLSSIKTVFAFIEWINEKDDEYLRKAFNLAPGILRSMLFIGDWLIYSIGELAKFVLDEDEKKEVLSLVKKLRVRMQYGVKEELLPLIFLKGIGRKRARKLFDASIKSPQDLLKEEEKAKKLIGEKTFERVKKTLLYSNNSSRHLSKGLA